MESKHQRWLDRITADAEWEKFPTWRRRLMASSAVFAELESEVAAVLAPAVIELRERHSLWEIAASIVDLEPDWYHPDREPPPRDHVLDRVSCVRLYLGWMLDTHLDHATEQSVIDACEGAELCEHGAAEHRGTCYGCEGFKEQFEDNGRPVAEMRPAAALAIRQRMAVAVSAALELGYSPNELSAVIARHKDGEPDRHATRMLDYLAEGYSPAKMLALTASPHNDKESD